MNRNNEVAVARVCAMLMIVGCHVCNWLGWNALTMVLNVGVYVFLFLSGFLYAKKTITHPWTFLKNRWVKLCVPMYVLVDGFLIYHVFRSDYEVLKAVPVYLLNLQGLKFVVNDWQVPQIQGMEHLWFLTVIMLCYFLLIVIKKLETKLRFRENGIREKAAIAVGIALLCLAAVVLVYTLHVQIAYMIVFFIGYIMGKTEKRRTSTNYLVWSLAMICAMGLRLVMRNLMDNTVTYESIVAPYTHIVLAIWIFKTIQFVGQKMPKQINKVTGNLVFRYSEELSYHIYLTHYMFLIGPLAVDQLPCAHGVRLIAFAVGTLISACVLRCWRVPNAENKQEKPCVEENIG